MSIQPKPPNENKYLMQLTILSLINILNQVQFCNTKFTFVFLFQIPTFPCLKLICLHTSHVLHSCQCPYFCVPFGFMLYIIIFFINFCTLDSLDAFDMQVLYLLTLLFHPLYPSFISHTSSFVHTFTI